MKHRKTWWMAVGLAVLVGLIGAAPGLAQNELFVPLLVYRTGPYAPNGIPIANGYIDYLKLLNARDGGVNRRNPERGDPILRLDLRGDRSDH